jgi:hypothetical protein
VCVIVMQVECGVWRAEAQPQVELERSKADRPPARPPSGRGTERWAIFL